MEGISRRKYDTLSEARLLVHQIAYRTQRRSRGLQKFSFSFSCWAELYPEKPCKIEFEVETSGVACRLLPHFLARTYGVVTREFCKSAYDKQYIKGTLPHVQAWGYGLNFAMTQNHELGAHGPRI